MSDKKGLSAFLQKQRKKTTKAKADGGQAAAEEQPVDQPGHDAEVAQKQDPTPAKTPNNQDSSEEEEDEPRDLAYGEIKETKEVARAKQNDDKIGYGYDDKPDKKVSASANAGPTSGPPRKTASDIKFGGARPKFARGAKAQFGGAFSGGLDELDDDGSGKKNTRVTRPAGENTAASEGGREFVNLSSAAKAGDRQRDPEEEKKSERPAAVKPTFRGKANLTKTGGGQDEENAGVVTSYGFNVALRGPRTDDQKEEGKGGEEGGQARRGGRGPRDKGRPFGQAEKDDDGDDGFEVVQDKAGTRRQARQNRRTADGSDSDEGFTATRGGGRGGRGNRGARGGFFTNSSRAGLSGDAKD